MKRNQITAGILGGLSVILALVSMQLYASRGIQARMKSASDYLARGSYESGRTDTEYEYWAGAGRADKQYEPYYLSSTYVTTRHRDEAGRTETVATEQTTPAYPTLAYAAQPPELRKLIRKGELNLEVKNCDNTSQKITDIVNKYSGYVLNAELSRYEGSATSGQVVLKVLPKDFDLVIKDIKALGKVERDKVYGEDVTEEYVDLQARLRNSQRVRERLLKILEQNATAVKDILEVERELARLGEKIEQIEGRMKFLDSQVNMSTITVHFHEPARVALGSLNVIKRFKETIRTALDTFINVFNGMIVFISALVPIIIWLGIIAAIIALVRKVFVKRRKI